MAWLEVFYRNVIEIRSGLVLTYTSVTGLAIDRNARDKGVVVVLGHGIEIDLGEIQLVHLVIRVLVIGTALLGNGRQSFLDLRLDSFVDKRQLA